MRWGGKGEGVCWRSEQTHISTEPQEVFLLSPDVAGELVRSHDWDIVCRWGRRVRGDILDCVTLSEPQVVAVATEAQEIPLVVAFFHRFFQGWLVTADVVIRLVFPSPGCRGEGGRCGGVVSVEAHGTSLHPLQVLSIVIIIVVLARQYSCTLGPGGGGRGSRGWIGRHVVTVATLTGKLVVNGASKAEEVAVVTTDIPARLKEDGKMKFLQLYWCCYRINSIRFNGLLLLNITILFRNHYKDIFHMGLTVWNESK